MRQTAHELKKQKEQKKQEDNQFSFCFVTYAKQYCRIRPSGSVRVLRNVQSQESNGNKCVGARWSALKNWQPSSIFTYNGSSGFM